MKKTIFTVIILSALFFIPSLAKADPIDIEVDGDLDDWGPEGYVDPSVGNWTPYPGVYYTEEFTGDAWEVGPGYGGHTFDAEALYVYMDDSTFYLALVTGFPDSGVHYYDQNENVNSYSAGDIALDFGADGTYEYGIEIGGHDTEDDSTYDGLGGVEGGLYKVLTWKETGEYPESLPFYMMTVEDDEPIYESDFVYTDSYDYGDDDVHWVIELAIDKEAFGSDWNDYGTVHWTQSCGNDVIEVTTNPTVPEPMSMVLFGTGALGLFGLRRRRKRG